MKAKVKPKVKLSRFEQLLVAVKACPQARRFVANNGKTWKKSLQAYQEAVKTNWALDSSWIWWLHNELGLRVREANHPVRALNKEMKRRRIA